MEITKENLQERRKAFIDYHANITKQINELTVLKSKLEGAVDLINDLIKEDDSTKTEGPTN